MKEKLEGLTNYDDTDITNKLTLLESRLNTILNDPNATNVIDTFQEIENFLQGITNTETFTGLLNDLKSDILALCANTYLPLSGGKISNTTFGKQLEIYRNIEGGSSVIKYTNKSEKLGYIGIGGSLVTPENIRYQPYFTPITLDENNNEISETAYKIFHEGNDGPGSGLDADLLDGVHLSGLFRANGYHTDANNLTVSGVYRTLESTTNTPVNYNGNQLVHFQWDGNAANQLVLRYDADAMYFRRKAGGTWQNWKQFAFTDSNVASANKLTIKRLTNEDLNTIKDFGFAIYIYIGSNSIQNIPSNGYGGTLQVSFRDSNNGIQKLDFFDDGASKSYIRKCVNGNWSAWKKMLTEDDLTDIKNRLTALENK